MEERVKEVIHSPLPKRQIKLLWSEFGEGSLPACQLAIPQINLPTIPVAPYQPHDRPLRMAECWILQLNMMTVWFLQNKGSLPYYINEL